MRYAAMVSPRDSGILRLDSGPLELHNRLRLERCQTLAELVVSGSMAVSAAIICFLQFTVMRFLLRKFCEAKKNRDLLGRGSMGWILFVLESHRPASRWRIPVAKIGGGLEVLFHPVDKCSAGCFGVASP